MNTVIYFFTKIEECMIIKVVIHQKIYRYTLLTILSTDLPNLLDDFE